MTYTTASPQTRHTTTGPAFYNLVWKWHFLASLYVLPFLAMLAVTGGIYLYKPQIENMLYADRMTVTVGETAQPFEAQIAAVATSAGITRLRGVTDHATPDRSTVIEFNDAEGVRSYAWVDPYTTDVLAIAAKDQMAMQLLRKFHGELLLGDFGTKFVELAAHWAIVMFITGIYMWWPRGSRTLKKAVTPPTGKGRKWVRETHMFTGFLAAVLVVPIIISGLPWTDVWGGGLSYVQEQTDQKSRSLRFGGGAPNSTASSGNTIAIATVFATAQTAGLVAPYELRPPKNAEGSYWIRSASTNRHEQSELIVDQYSGDILARVNFADNPPLAKAVSLGISFHQGELYGWLNLAQNTIGAVAALVLSISGFAAWWMRRPQGSLGVPSAPEAALGPGMILLVIGLAIMFPLMGGTLVVALCLDWLIFKRLGWFRPRTA
jgi:uncharacterized iron-regulated membrane protein